jgi:hypothetical protein
LTLISSDQQIPSFFVLVDAPCIALGYDIPEGTFVPRGTDYKTPEALGAAFGMWTAGFYAHPDPLSGSLDGLDITSRKGTLPEPTDIPENHLTPDDDLEPEAAKRSDLAFVPYERVKGILNEQRTAFFVKDGGELPVLPEVEAVYLTGLRSNWHSIWACVLLRKECEEHAKLGENVRKFGVVEMPEANHIVSSPRWDRNTKLLIFLLDSLTGFVQRLF